MQTVTFAMRAMGRLGVPRVILTNAAGGISPNCSRGALMVIDDHINLMGSNPLVGPNDERFGLRFPDMTNVYSPRLRGIADEAGQALGVADSARHLCRGARPELRNAGGDSRVQDARRGCGRDVDGAGSDRRASHGPRSARHLLHHQCGGRGLPGAVASFGSHGNRAAGEGAVHCAARGHHWPALTPPSAEASAARLVAAARQAREHAVADFSHFKVGAALETDTGEIITGCNIENATYGLTICAERVAIFKALSEGKRSFTRIAVVADTASPTPPCGACRQIIWEFCGDITVVLANLSEVSATLQMKDLLPLPFDKSLLGR